VQVHPSQVSLVSDFCSSVRDFASDFLQIPRHHGHSCLSLTVPTAKSVVDFHHLVVAHAGHTHNVKALVSTKRELSYIIDFSQTTAYTTDSLGMAAQTSYK